MCGIVGYIGKKPAQPILLNSLAKLEYRGYDSCGIALANPGINIYKDAIRVAALKSSLPDLPGTIGIGHTRWATHGRPCKINSHPILDCTGKIAVVHNGVIGNCEKLKAQLTAEGHHFISETDTEVISHLIEKYYYCQSTENVNETRLRQAIESALKDVEGSYAIIVLVEDQPRLVFARRDSPLIIGVGDRENYIASDVPAMLDYTNQVIYLEDGDIGIVDSDSFQIFQDGRQVNREIQRVLWDAEQAQKGGYEHFMLKEIHEQPRIIREMIAEYLGSSETLFDSTFINANHETLLLGCGTSYHAALLGKLVNEQLLGRPFRVEIASEFNYYPQFPIPQTGIGITQSGETADTLKAMKRLKEAGSHIVAITNVVGSSASKIADQTMYTRAGPEISVAATKTFTAQLMALYWMALSGSGKDSPIFRDLSLELRTLPEKMQQILINEEFVAAIAEYLAKYDNVFFIGKGINLPIAMEGALKLKEIAYIHSEALAGGEIKHGPLAILGSQTPVIAIVARDQSYNAMMINIKQIKARGSPVFAIAEEEDDDVTKIADATLTVPAINSLFSPFINTIAVQLLAYYAAKSRNCSLDYPRNLAKSVTVE